MKLLETFNTYLTESAVSAAAAHLGESTAATKKAFGAAIPAILGGVLNASHNKNTFGQIWDLINHNDNDPNILNDVSRLFGGQSNASAQNSVGSSLLKLLFGNNSTLLNALSGLAGFNNTGSAGKLLSLAAPLVMSYLQKKARSENFGSSGLSTWLSGYKHEIHAALPSGWANNLGFSNLMDEHTPATSFNKYESHNAGGGDNWWLWLAGLLLTFAALWFLMRGCNRKDVAQKALNQSVAVIDSAAIRAEEAAKAAQSALDSAAAAIKAKWALLGASVKNLLPGGVELNVPENGIEAQLIKWLNDKSKKVDKTTWFNFDRILFETGSAELNNLSNEQIGNIVAILKAYPAVELKVGGYTDNVGDPAFNKSLSQKRAEAVVAALVAGGIDAKRLVAEGYGDQHPVASNDTEEGREQNRRVAVRVTKK